MIDSELLNYLIVFSETGSLLKAGEILNLSQPSLSKAMRKLEAQLGLTIFDRTANKMTLNDDGKEVLYYAKDIIAMIDRLQEKAKDLKEKSRHLKIAMTAPGPIYRYDFLFDPSDRQDVVIIDDEDKLIGDLLNNIYDLIFINDRPYTDNLVCKKVMTEHLYISVPKTHFLAKHNEKVTFEDIDGNTFLLSQDIGKWTSVLEKHMKRSRFLRQSDRRELKEIAEYSSIPNFLTNISMQKNSTESRISIPIADPDAYMDFYAVTKAGNAQLFDLLK